MRTVVFGEERKPCVTDYGLDYYLNLVRLQENISARTHKQRLICNIKLSP